MLGTRIEGLGYWTRPTRFSDIDLHKVYGCEISVDAIGCTGEGGMRNALPYSMFREGPPVDIRNIYGNFFTEFTNCLWKHGLANTFGLEFYQGQPRKMIEFSFDAGLLLVEEEELRAELREGTGQFTLQVTAWAITIDNGTVKHKGTKYCLKPPDEEHRPIIVPTPTAEVSDIVEILRDRGYLVTQHMNT
jgi:hypothetical protein